MKLPNAHTAVVSMRKLREYCLAASHPRGKHKARVFAAALGLTVPDAAKLRRALLRAALVNEAQPAEADHYGQRYVVDLVMKHSGREATIRSAWIVRQGEDAPRFTSCYVLGRREG